MPILKALKIPRFYKEKEKKISNILTTLSKKIHLNQQTNQTLEHIAQAIFKSWFVDFDPVRAKADCLANGGTMADANLSAMGVISGKSPDELAQLQANNPQDYDKLWQLAEHFPCELVENVPKSWINGNLGDITKSYREKIKNNQAVVLSAVSSGNLVKSDEYFNKQVYSKSIEKYLKVNKWDFAFNPSRINIGSIGLQKEDYLGAVSPVYEVFSVYEDYHWFVENFICLESTKHWINTLCNGSVRQTLKLTDFQSIPCVIPNKKIIDDFNKIWLNFYEMIKSLDKENEYLTKMRDELLPKLLSGEIEL